MPAAPSRIGFVTQKFRTATAGPDAEVTARYGDDARDTKESVETFFDDVGDAQAMADERLALLSADRRRFSVSASGIVALPADLPAFPVVPTMHVLDEERSADMDALCVEIGLDFEAGVTTFVVWG